MRKLLWRRVLHISCILLCALLYNEFFVYYVVLARCDWPVLPSVTDESVVRALVLSDPHLLGPTGHWWDRLRREWQMQRTFQTSLRLHNPELVFILGDLFDDGKWSSDVAFQDDVRRFHRMFAHSEESVKLVSVMGNHDVGFHYMISSHKLERFVRAVNSSDSVTLLKHRNVTFITVNSMAFEGDDCTMCTRARRDLSRISEQLQCAQNNWETPKECTQYLDRFDYSPPILLQHFPMYRTSDEMCEGPDSAPQEYKYDKFREKYDCLSQAATQQLMDSVKPRLIISGHTHYFCRRRHDNGVVEWSVPSFSWRNIKGPSFLMVTLTGNDVAVSKCFMPNENTVYLVYTFVIALTALYILVQCTRCGAKRRGTILAQSDKRED